MLQPLVKLTLDVGFLAVQALLDGRICLSLPVKEPINLHVSIHDLSQPATPVAIQEVDPGTDTDTDTHLYLDLLQHMAQEVWPAVAQKADKSRAVSLIAGVSEHAE